MNELEELKRLANQTANPAAAAVLILHVLQEIIVPAKSS